MTDAPVDIAAPPAAPAIPVEPARRRPRPRRGRSLLAMVLQVVLIAVGVFLGLAGEEWRQDRENRRLATETLRRFRTEIAANRATVLEIKDYHAERYAELNAYFAAPVETRGAVELRFAGVRAPRFQRTAWELALASGTIAYIDPELAFVLSQTYGDQSMTDQLGANMMQVMYERPPGQANDAFLATIHAYYGDLSGIEPGLVTAYDTLLVALDEALAQ
jgi:hypothetical protein